MSMPSSLASALASSETALIQPWSAAGALNANLMSPAWAALCSWVLGAFAVAVGAAAAGLSLLEPHAVLPAARAAPATSTGTTRLSVIGVLLLIGLPIQN